MRQEIPATHQNKASQDCTHNSSGSDSLYIHHVNPCCTNAVLLLVQFSCSERWGMQKSSLQDFSEKGCWISAAHHCLPIFSDRLRPQSTTQDAPTCHQCLDSTLQRVHFTISTHHLTSPFIHKNKNLAQDQPDRRMSSVDAHGVSSCLGCSRILRHLISFFLTSSQDFRSRKNMKKPWDKKFQPHLRTRPVKPKKPSVACWPRKSQPVPTRKDGCPLDFESWTHYLPLASVIIDPFAIWKNVFSRL